MPASMVKASFNLTEEELKALRKEASDRGVSVTQVLREALADHVFLKEQQDGENKKILLESDDGSMTQVVLR